MHFMLFVHKIVTNTLIMDDNYIDINYEIKSEFNLIKFTH